MKVSALNRFRFICTRNTLVQFHRQRRYASYAKGFTLAELLAVLSLVSILAIVSTPNLNGAIIEGKISPIAKELTATADKIRASYSNQSVKNDYSLIGKDSVGTDAISKVTSGLTSALFVSTTGGVTRVGHDIGAVNSLLSASSASILKANDAFSITVPTVNDAGCPGLAVQMNMAAEIIKINSTVVKASGGTYNQSSAQTACTPGDTNTFVFTFR